MYYDYLVVGAGLAGAVFAFEMKKRGRKCLVIDRRQTVGGNLYTEETAGIQVHKYGAHIFHTSDQSVWSFVNQFADFNHYVNSPIALYKGEMYNLPFNMNTFNKMWGVVTPGEAKQKIQEQIAQYGVGDPKNLEEQALSLAGKDVYEKLIKGYTQKQWGCSCRELPPFIIKRVPLRFTYNNNYFNDRYQGIPIGGYTRMIRAMLDGTEVALGIDYKQFVREKAGISFGRIYYTGMIDEYFDCSLGALQYRTLRFEEETLEGCADYQGNAVVNYTDSEVPYTRIIEHKHFEFGEQKDTVITREYPARWEKGCEPYYPVNNEANNRLLEAYRSLARKEKNVLFGGRLGLYQYLDMDKVIESVRRQAKECEV